MTCEAQPPRAARVLPLLARRMLDLPALVCLWILILWPLRVIGWLGEVVEALGHDLATAMRRFSTDPPLAQARVLAVAVLLIGGAFLLGVLTLPNYDRALVLTGRSEVLSMQLDDRAFGALDFAGAVLRADLDSPATEPGPVRLDIAPGTSVRFERIGRGALHLTFAAGTAAPADPGCIAPLRVVGAVSASGTQAALCEGAVVLVPLAPGSDPLVVALSGGLVVGEEVSQGAGPRPILLDATASLLVRHAGPVFRLACRLELFEHLCDRFVANSLVLAPGNSVRAYRHGRAEDVAEVPAHEVAAAADGAMRPAGLGFLRIDPNDLQSGMSFNLAAPAEAFEVTRIEGETFTVKESLFDVVQKSPLMHTLNTSLAAVGLLWYFLRLRRGEGGGGEGTAAAALLCLGLAMPAPALAQQALLRADETGQAMLRARGDRCYAITPAHVIGTETSALVTAPGRQQGEGDLLRRVPAAPEPIALLSLRGIPLALCPAFEGPPSLDSLLRNRAAAVLRLVRADGGIDRLPLLVASVEIETLEVQTEPGTELKQGMSGGTVLVGDQPVGLLVDVFNEGRSGRVARLDRVFERLAPHLATSPAPVPSLTPAQGTVAYDVVRSSAAPISLANKVSSLIGDGPGPWRVAADGRTEVIMKAVGPTSGVALDVSGLPDPPRAVEVLAGRSDKGPWQSLAGISLEPGDTVQTRRFPATRLPYLLLRAWPGPGQATFAVRGLRLLP